MLGVLPVANGGTGTSTAFTQNSVIFAGAGGAYSQDPTKFVWDATNDRLGIGNNAPSYNLDITGTFRGTGAGLLGSLGINGALFSGYHLGVNGNVYIGDPAASGQTLEGKFVIRDDNSSGWGSVWRNMSATGCIQHHWANDSDDLDAYSQLNGSSKTTLSGARSFNIGANYGKFGVWTNKSAGEASARNHMTILGVASGASEGLTGFGTQAPVDKVTVVGPDNSATVSLGVYRANIDYGIQVSAIGSSGNSQVATVGSGAQMFLAAGGTTVVTLASSSLTLSQPLIYGGVTLSNSVQGTGAMVLATSPTLTTPVIGAATGTSLSVTGAITAYNATAIPAGGTTGTGFKFSSTGNFGVFFGSGAPTLTAAKGSLYLRSDGSTTNDRAYINTDSGTTWTALTTAA